MSQGSRISFHENFYCDSFKDDKTRIFQKKKIKKIIPMFMHIVTKTKNLHKINSFK